MKAFSITMLSLMMLVAGKIQAYTYKFNNDSQKDIEVQFQLIADITTNNKLQKVMIRAKDTASITIPEWFRSGLCMDAGSIEVRFLPDGKFTQPTVKSAISGSLCGDQTFGLSYDAKSDTAVLSHLR